jgi:hypothetical protein
VFMDSDYSILLNLEDGEWLYERLS